jgi:hypothetical protein
LQTPYRKRTRMLGLSILDRLNPILQYLCFHFPFTFLFSSAIHSLPSRPFHPLPRSIPILRDRAINPRRKDKNESKKSPRTRSPSGRVTRGRTTWKYSTRNCRRAFPLSPNP